MLIRKLHIRRYSQIESRSWFGLDAMAQATTELAVIGTIMLLIFGALFRYGISYNLRQQTQMYAFRKALELTKRRYDEKDAQGNRVKFASVSLNVMSNTYKPSEMVNAPPESIGADGNAAITAEVEARDFGGDDGPEDLNDIGASYYQIGNKMIADDQYIEPPYIKVKRRIRHDKMPKTTWDAIMDWLPWGSGPREDTTDFQPLPYWEQEQNTNTTYNSQYATSESQDRADYGEVSTTRTVAATIFKPQPFYAIQTWDTDVLEIYGIEGGGSPQDMVVKTDQTFTQTRAWESQK